MEFKSDRAMMADKEFAAEAVAFANAEGGDLLIGVEDDGAVTGLNPKRASVSGLSGVIRSRTNPHLDVTMQVIDLQGRPVARITIPKSKQLVSTMEGLYLRRRLKPDGSPEKSPFYSNEFMQRLADVRELDPSSLPMANVRAEQLDPLQRLRLRTAVKKYGGDKNLLELSDAELDTALHLVHRSDGRMRPTLTGLLLLGSEELLQKHLPAHRVAFQVLRGTDVVVNKFFHKSLLETFEEVESMFAARVEEAEVADGLYRVSIPNYEGLAFRETLLNAMIHRDYLGFGTLQVKFDDDGLTVANPGGFIDGINAENIRAAAPRSRNPLLAAAFQRIGLAEGSSRGVDKIFSGALRFGRGMPNYSRSGSHHISVHMRAMDPDFEFIRMVLRHEKDINALLTVDSLIILSQLRDAGRLPASELARSVQKPERDIRESLETLVETGLLAESGADEDRIFSLRPEVYRKSRRDLAEPLPLAQRDLARQERAILNHIEVHGGIRRRDVVDLCGVTAKQANSLLARLMGRGAITRIGEGKSASYVESR